MQEELEQRSVAISIKAGKLTANLLKKALEKALADGCDVLGLGNLVSQRRPQAWRELAPRWETVLSQCGFQLEAQAQVQPREEEGL